MTDIRKYLLALLLTLTIFGAAFYIANELDARRLAEIRSIQNTLAIDLLSSETQFDLLGQLDCKTITEQPILSEELNDLAERLSYTESRLESNNPEVLQLKKQYSLLQIKDYLLMREISEKCEVKPVFILYFYSNEGDCPECARAGEVLTYLRETYPELRVYSFDYYLDLSALQTLIALREVEPRLPAFVVNDERVMYGFKTVSGMQELIPELKTLATSTTATTTKQ
jgi:hypothetical protein